MIHHKHQHNIAVVFLLGVILLFILLVFVVYTKNEDSQKHNNDTSYEGYINHTSEDLEISLMYPQSWYVDDRYYNILLTDYYTNQNQNDKPSTGQIEIQISRESLCQDTIEKNLILGGCGEGQIVKNIILQKESKRLQNGILKTFRVRYPDDSEKTLYYLKNKSKIIQISKRPDPSQHEEEFMRIVKSIRFL